MDEVAVDEGGLRKEFFQLISHDLLNPQYGMFKEYSESRLIWFNDDPLVSCSTCLMRITVQVIYSTNVRVELSMYVLVSLRLLLLMPIPTSIFGLLRRLSMITTIECFSWSGSCAVSPSTTTH